MSEIRYNALQELVKTPSQEVKNGNSKRRISEIYAQNVFTLVVMKDYLSEGTYLHILAAIKNNKQIDFTTAENVAKGMKKWATDKGVTHFTHWFQPLTGLTAEKHDAFFKPSLDSLMQGVENLTASELIQREPDASSFPSGGLRSTHQARGYSVWDPSSPAFILDTENGKTLYIPSIFISYTGESLDFKTPLLKSAEILNKAATKVCHFFDETVHNVIATLGWEQEYFLVDEKLYNARPDLIMTGRTLFGAPTPKGQQLEDHYFGTIPERVQKYMQDFEQEALTLGIPVLTRHNEVAPGQYECAPMFEEINVAIDHNLLLMNIMERTAKKYSLRVLVHEKPFAGVNGSGKHNNWSLATNGGKNLLSPGSQPSNNLYFLTFFINVVKAVDAHADLLRASIATASNDHRLGANEAPPAIISVFTGSLMEKVLEGFKIKGLHMMDDHKEIIDLNIPKIPAIAIDNTDRNRTSPFPFTGNKFEFRAVGSSANCSLSMTVLNSMVAKQLNLFHSEVDGLISKGSTTEQAIVSVLQDYIKQSAKTVFNGDGYSKEWEKEASNRGLNNRKTTPEALQAFISPSTVALFTDLGVFNTKEVHARYEVLMEHYVKQIEIEAMVSVELAQTYILPGANQYLLKLIQTLKGLKDIGLDKAADNSRAEVELLFSCMDDIKGLTRQLTLLIQKALSGKNIEDKAQTFSTKVLPLMAQLRASADQLELMVDDAAWKLPKYRELLFLR
jgi:glutamine synthetase